MEIAPGVAPGAAVDVHLEAQAGRNDLSARRTTQADTKERLRLAAGRVHRSEHAVGARIRIGARLVDPGVRLHDARPLDEHGRAGRRDQELTAGEQEPGADDGHG